LIAGYRQAAVLADALSLPHLHRSLQGSLQEEMESAERFADLSKAEIIPLAI
jgi:hypothetical protein